MAEDKKLGIVLIGVSDIAVTHVKALQEIKEVELLGIFGSDFQRTKNFAEKFHIKVYRRLEEVLADLAVDIVDIVGLPCRHADYGIAAARAGKHIIVEKPMDISLERAKELVAACRESGVFLATIYQQRFSQVIKELKKIIDNGKLGRVFLASARLANSRQQTYYDEHDGWRGKKEIAGGGVLINQAIHVVDSLVYLLGEASLVAGDTETFKHNIEVEDTAVATVRFKNNALGVICASTAVFASLPNLFEVHGTRGSAIIQNETLTLLGVGQSRLNKLITKIWRKIQSRLPYILNVKRKFRSGYHKENLLEIIRAIKNNTQPPVGFEQGLKSLEIVEAIVRASETKKTVSIRPAAKMVFTGNYWQRYLAEAKAKKPKVLIINPLNETAHNVQFSHISVHRLRQPLDLAYSSSFLKKITTVQLVDAAILKWSTAKTIEFINLAAPEILIVSSSPPDRWQNPDLDISNIFDIFNRTTAKKKILVGAHGSVTPDWIFANCRVDFVVRGEPELTVEELVKNLLENQEDFSETAGLSYKNNNTIVHNRERVFDSDLDDYPFPDYESLPMHLYGYSTDDLPIPFSLMLTSRGCPGQCIFCLKKMMPGIYRARSADNVYQEIKYLVDNFAIKSIYFQDWEFLIDKERIRQLCQMLINSPDIEVRWGCSARATSFDPETIVLMKKAGCALINFGFESGSAEILNQSYKGVSLEKVKEVVQLCREQGINIRSFCLVNLPGENKKTLKESAAFITKNDLNVPRINIPIPYPGTQLAKMADINSWEMAAAQSGKIKTIMNPEVARKFLRKRIWQGKFGKLYFLNPRFCFYIFGFLKKKFL